MSEPRQDITGQVLRNTVVLLKGATQYVAEPSGRVTLAVAGPAWTAQAGSGDVLAGAALGAGLGLLVPWLGGRDDDAPHLVVSDRAIALAGSW